MGKPLEGIRILDCTQYLSGPLTTTLLCDMGAEVIKIERPPYGDQSRFTKAVKDGYGTSFVTRNRGKKSVLMDLKDPAHKELFLKMVKTADMVVENNKPGVFDKMGFDFDTLRAINPAVVLVSISGFGATGPYRDRGAYDLSGQAEGGIIGISGPDPDHPVKCGAYIADEAGGLFGCIGALAALFDAKRTGEGRHVDASILDGVFSLCDNYFTIYTATGEMPSPAGNHMITIGASDDFLCKDGKRLCLVASTDEQFGRLCVNVLNKPELAEDPRFLTTSGRAVNYMQLKPLIQEGLLKYDRDELCALLGSNDIVYGNINMMDDLLVHPQLLARNMIAKVVYDNGVAFTTPGSPIRMSGYENTGTYHAAELGQDTIEVLSEIEEESVLHGMFDGLIEESRAKLKDMLSEKS